METSNNKSPVLGYKIALVNNANLNQQYVITQPAVPEQRFEDGTLAMPAIPEKSVKQFEYASKRLMRAIRKARKLAQAGNRSIMLFCQRENGQHFPINYRKKQFTSQELSLGHGAQVALKMAIPGTPIEEQKQAMTMFRVLSKQRPLLTKKEA